MYKTIKHEEGEYFYIMRTFPFFFSYLKHISQLKSKYDFEGKTFTCKTVFLYVGIAVFT